MSAPPNRASGDEPPGDDPPMTSGRGRRGHLLRYHEFFSRGWLRLLRPVEFAVWSAHEHLAIDASGGLVNETPAEIAAVLGHETTAAVRAARRALVAAGLAEITREGGGGTAHELRMLVPPHPTESTLGRERIAAAAATSPRPKKKKLPGRDSTTSESSFNHDAGRDSTGGESRFDRVAVEIRPGAQSSLDHLPGRDSTTDYIRRVYDEDDVNDGRGAAVADAVNETGAGRKADAGPTFAAPPVGQADERSTSKQPAVAPVAPAAATGETTAAAGGGQHADLFGPKPARKLAIKAERKAAGPTREAVAAVVAHFVAAWAQIYAGEYQTTGRAYVTAAWLLKLDAVNGDVARATAVLDRYLACRDAFFTRVTHSLPHLQSESTINQFLGTSRSKGAYGHSQGAGVAGDVVSRRGRDGINRLEPADPLAGIEVAR